MCALLLEIFTTATRGDPDVLECQAAARHLTAAAREKTWTFDTAAEGDEYTKWKRESALFI